MLVGAGFTLLIREDVGPKTLTSPEP